MEYIRTFSRDFEVGEQCELAVDSRSGTVSVRGDDTTRARIEVVARLWADDDAEADDQLEMIKRGVKLEGKTVSIRAPTLLRPRPFIIFGMGPRIDYQVTVPRRTKANIASRSGRVEVESIGGPVEVVSRSGRVSISDIARDVTIESRSGSVQARSIAGALEIESRSGSVRVEGVGKDLRMRSRSGSIQIEQVRGAVEVATRSGGISVIEAGSSVKLSTHAGAVRYEGAVRGDFDIDVTAGAVRLAVDPESVFFLDAESSHGAVRSDLEMRTNARTAPVAREDAPTVRIRARAGAIHLVPR